MINLTLTPAQAEALGMVITEHMYMRGDIRHYVDTRYSTHDISFRNKKIGDLQQRFDALTHILQQLNKEMTNETVERI